MLKEAHKDMGLDYDKVRGGMRYITITPRMAEHLYQHGEALYDKDVGPSAPRGTKTLSDFVQTNPTPEHLTSTMVKLAGVMRKVASELKISRGIEFVKETDPNANWRGFLSKGPNPDTGNYVIKVNLSRILTPHDLYSSMSHELGHVIKVDLLKTAPDVERAPIWKAHDAWRARQTYQERTVGDIRRTRDNAISEMTGARAMHNHYKLSELDPQSRNYFLSFDEWFSEQVAKWMQTDERPLGVVDHFFKRVANKIRKMVAMFRQARTGGAENPDAAVKEWLNKRFGAPTAWAEPIKQQFDMDTTVRNANAMDKEGAPETRAVPMQGSTAGGRNIIDNLPPIVRGNGDGMAAHADRMNWFYNLALSLPQVASINKDNQQLTRYLGMHRMANTEKNVIMNNAMRRVEQWAQIKDPKQLFGLTNFIQDYAHLDTRPDPNNPADTVFRDLVKKHGLSTQSVKLFSDMVGDFDKFLDKYRNLLINDAMRIKDDTRRQNNLQKHQY